ncbi:MAG: arginine--tRNA ligase [Candidatus Eisenbacteria bacterium]|nr:arginine--tRNA ligase [Candidatus Eisenbacteria bacterium]
MLRSKTEDILRRAVRSRWGEEAAADLRVEPPREKSHGDFAANAAMVLAKGLRRKPRELAEELKTDLEASGFFRSVEIAGPGFLNLKLRPAALHDLLGHILEEGERYGRSEPERALRRQIEFVSANPTGPLNVVSARAAAVGDTLARLFEATGHAVDREFYVNDAGSQVDHLVDTVLWYLEGKAGDFPGEGYRGAYVEELSEEARAIFEPRFPRSPEGLGAERIGPAASALLSRLGSSPAGGDSALPDPCPIDDAAHRLLLRLWTLEKMLAAQRADLEKFGVRFDRWFRESELHAEGAVEAALADLERAGDVYEKDGARWFRSSAYVDDEDRVVIRSNGAPTYFLADVAYHRDKKNRGYDHAIDILGPDHHGHVPRMQSALLALGAPENWLEVMIVQQVNLLRGGETVKMSKRAGEFVSLRELIEEVGADAARFFFLMLRPNSHLNFDLDLAKSRSLDNPVYYVQYAHARICSVFRHAEAAGVAPAAGESAEDRTGVDREEEFDILRMLDAFPDVIALAAATREPHRLPTYLKEVAAAFHGYYHKVQVVTEDAKSTAARLALLRAIRLVLRNGLDLIGVHAPESM